MAKFNQADLADLMPIFILAKIDPSGTLDEVQVAKAISDVIDRHVEIALRQADQNLTELVAVGDWDGQYSLGFLSTVSQMILDVANEQRGK